MLDMIIRNGRIVDGTGLPGYYGDLGIKEGLGSAQQHDVERCLSPRTSPVLRSRPSMQLRYEADAGQRYFP